MAVLILVGVLVLACACIVRDRRAAAEREARLVAMGRERTIQLETSAQRYRELVEKTAAIPFELALPSLDLVYIAPQAATLFGCSVADLKDPQLLTSKLHPNDRGTIRAAVRAIRRGERDARDAVDFRVVTPSGRCAYMRMLFSVGEDCIRGLCIDVTRQHKLEQELAQAQKLESVGRLAAGVAHEINTPVQFVSDSVQFVRDAVTDLIDLLEKQSRALDTTLVEDHVALVRDAREAAERADVEYLRENVPKALERALDGLERVTTIVRSMKAFAHPAGEMTGVDLNAAVANTLVVARNEYRYVAELVTDYGELPPVTCNLGEINQAVLNLVVNAAHAIGDVVAGMPGERGTITIRTRHDDGVVTIEVADTGAGIPRAIRSRIFEPFFTTKPVGTGTGQGLALARAVADRHRGWVTFESEVGVGTTFMLCIPVTAMAVRGSTPAMRAA